ncbi:MAG: helix-turn-helix domain-containing protein [Pseudomonadota bacterium]
MTSTATAATAQPGVGPQIREWRTLRRLSQMDLALEVGISPRHLSFVETGRSRPGADVLLAIADRLELPLRMRNGWLLAAGYAPRYSEHRLDSDVMNQVREPLQRLLDAHHPYPGIVVDRHWNVVLVNRAAGNLMSMLPEHLRQPVPNVFRTSLHPDGFARMTRNFPDWGHYLLQELQRLLVDDRDPAIVALAGEVRAYPNVQELLRSTTTPAMQAGRALLVPCIMDMGGHTLSLFTTLTRFGTPLDITLAELCVELFYPADDATGQLLRAMG